ncbi:MAG: class I SAM-dependent rRNA methyltransferase [Planctomycetota bacterium]|nr:class I SAM-dependent rRNA methyltransferase [Planctomycetota bacterium]
MAIPELRLQIRVHGRHPWFYRKMIRKPAERIAAGSVVHVVDRQGRPVGSGFYNPRTELALRMFSDARISDPARHFTATLQAAVALREELLSLPEHTDAYRVVHSEADGLPGFILDRLGPVYVGQIHCLGMLQQIEPLGEWLRARDPNCRLMLLQDKESSSREGMERLPMAAPQPVEVREHGILYGVEAGGGHKTGFFADQRDNRLLVRQLAQQRTVLDLCCNGGGFALNAAAGGARRVLAADLDEHMVAATADNAKRNDLRIQAEHADAFDLLRDVDAGAYDLMILDPPKWVRSKNELETGISRYRDLNRLAFAKVRPGGLVVTCSCSGSVSEDHFLRMLREAAAQANRDVRILSLRGAAPDHPVALECPETRYLKVVVMQVRS